MKKQFYMYWCLLLALPFGLKAAQYHSIQPGFWNEPQVWFGQQVPACVNGDTVVVDHALALLADLNLSSGCVLLINSTGGLCGHYILTVPGGAMLNNYGLLELDQLNVPGGTVNSYPPADLILTQYGIFSNGAVFNNFGNMQVGPWFVCQMPEYNFLNTTDINNQSLCEQLNLYIQNSAGTHSTDNENSVINVVNFQGEILFTGPLNQAFVHFMQQNKSLLILIYTKDKQTCKQIIYPD